MTEHAQEGSWRPAKLFPVARALGLLAAGTGHVSFGGRTFRIDRGVFNPEKHLSGVAFARNLSEWITPGLDVLEIGTGCGILAASAADCGACVTATELDDRSVRCARYNLAELIDADRVVVHQGDLFRPVAGRRFDLVLTNPPYEIGPSRNLALASPDFLERFGAEVATYAPRALLGYPADEASTLAVTGLRWTLLRRVATEGADLGIFNCDL